MSFELRPGESLRKGIRRIVRKQMEKALGQLIRLHKGSRDEHVHEARKTFKKIRAMLRLVRPAIGEERYRAENTCFREAGRPLTEVRDAKIFIETLDHVAKHFKEHIAGRSFGDARQALQDNLRAVRKRVLDEEDAFAVVADAVRQARARLKSWAADIPKRWVDKGLEDVYRQAGDACQEATADPTVENLHEWRKQAKYLRYQLEVPPSSVTLTSCWRPSRTSVSVTVSPILNCRNRFARFTPAARASQALRCTIFPGANDMPRRSSPSRRGRAERIGLVPLCPSATFLCNCSSGKPGTRRGAGRWLAADFD
jgi:CHAD domain-containing protein